MAPDLIYLEVVSMLRKGLRRRLLPESRAAEALQSLVTVDIGIVDHRALLPRIWELRGTVTAYDAAYVAVAEDHGARLVTRDARLARAEGPRCEIELVE